MKSFSPYPLPVFCALFFFGLLGMSSSAFAQTYSRLSPNSDLYCIYLPNGKTQIAVGKNDRYKKMGFKKAQKRTAKMISAERRKARKVTKLIKKLERQKAQGGITASLTPKEVRAAQKFYLEGDLATEIPPSISENIQLLETIRSNYYANIEFDAELIKLIKKCKKRELPSPGTFATMFINVMTNDWDSERDLSGSGYVVVAAIVPAYIAVRAPYLCYDHPRQSVRYEPATTDPCLAEGIKNFNTEECANLVERDAKGRPQFYLAALDKRNFSFKNRPGARSFSEAAGAAETSLRTGEFTGWSGSVSYAVVNNSDACQESVF